MNKIYFNPATQYENTGDLLIMTSLLTLLRNHGEIWIDNHGKPKWFVEELCTASDKMISKHSNKSMFKILISALLNPIRKDHYYLVLSPGHFSRRQNGDLLPIFRQSLKLFVLKSLGCKIVRTGFSIGPFSEAHAWMESLTSRFYHKYAVRDTQSFSLGQRYKFRNLSYSPDLAWAYTPTESLKSNKQASEKYIVLSFRSNAIGKTHEAQYINPILEKLRQIVELKNFNDYSIKISYQVLYDRDPSIQILDFISKYSQKVEFIDEKLLLESAFELYQNAELVLSNRLHVLLLASRGQTLSLPLVEGEDNKKITSIYIDNGLENLILDIGEAHEVTLQKVVGALNSQQMILKKFDDAFLKNSTVIEESISNVFNI